jgi:hypothetical protein
MSKKGMNDLRITECFSENYDDWYHGESEWMETGPEYGAMNIMGPSAIFNHENY